MGKWSENSRTTFGGGNKYSRNKLTGGGFKNDEKMPLYSDAEFAACSPLVSLQIDIEQTLDTTTNTVVIDGNIVPLAEARQREQALEAEYRRVVTEETRARKPDATDKDIEIRLYDIKKSIEGTDHISVNYTGGLPSGGGSSGRY
ncbi:MAG: hypothetical protein EBV03_04870 [Proteobacteria bacterium]|nr:hypothetical protein [Pseudomonadota bacterium]